MPRMYPAAVLNANRLRIAIGLGVAVLLVSAIAGCGANNNQAAPTSGSPTTSGAVTPAQAREIARDAYVYGFPMVDNYRIQYAYFVDQQNSEYKGARNQIHNTARVFTPADTAIQTPNSDTHTRSSAPICGPSRWC
jgi:hypothetical protein